MLSVKQGGIKFHFLKGLWYDSTWDWTQVSRAIGEQQNKKIPGSNISHCLCLSVCLSLHSQQPAGTNQLFTLLYNRVAAVPAINESIQLTFRVLFMVVIFEEPLPIFPLTVPSHHLLTSHGCYRYPPNPEPQLTRTPLASCSMSLNLLQSTLQLQ